MPLNPRFQTPAELWISFLDCCYFCPWWLIPVSGPLQGRGDDPAGIRLPALNSPFFPQPSRQYKVFFPVTFGCLCEVTISREIFISAAQQGLLAQKEWME